MDMGHMGGGEGKEDEEEEGNASIRGLCERLAQHSLVS